MSGDENPSTPSGDPFADLDAFLRLPRVSGLLLAPDGSRLVVGTAVPATGGDRFRTSVWEVDPTGERPARPLTHSAEGETPVAFTPRGDLLMISARPQPPAGQGGGGEPGPALWLLPAAGGDARLITAPRGGPGGVTVAGDGTLIYAAQLMPSAAGPADDARLRAARTAAGATAILHEGFPVRFWDHDLGPARPRLFAAALPAGDGTGGAPSTPRDLTGHVAGALGGDHDVTPDGRTVVTVWTVPEPGGSSRATLVALDTTTGERRVLADDPGHEYTAPHVSPDGTTVVVLVRSRATSDEPPQFWMGLVPVAGGPVRLLARDWDRIPQSAAWTPDGTALVVNAADHGRCPLWRIDAVTGEVTRLTDDDAAYSDQCVAPDGRHVYALRAGIGAPPAPVRVALDGSGRITALPGPADVLAPGLTPPGRLTEVTATAADGTPLRGWLALPRQAAADAPVPLLLWIHSGPIGSFNTWSWQWNPWTAVARGHAVLLADPAISLGYGTDFMRRGWPAWGGVPFTDLMTLTDAAQARPDIDPGRSAALGGSFGGYMANWIAGHTDRFDAVVTHAGAWDMKAANAGGDLAYFFDRVNPAAAADANSPHHAIGSITTPMLVIHGDRDYRIPIGEALHLWWDLASHHAADDGSTPHKFLYFPDEGHLINRPTHARIWYETVLAFLAHHLDGEEWRRPDLLG